MEDSNSILNRSFRSNTLDRLDNNLLSLFVGSKTRLVHGLVDIRHSSRLCLIFERIDKLLLSLFCRKTRNLLQLLLSRFVQTINLLRLTFNCFLLIFQVLTLCIQLILSSLHFALLLIELLISLLYALLLLMKLLFCLTYMILVFKFESNKLFFRLNNFIFLNHFCLLFRLA